MMAPRHSTWCHSRWRARVLWGNAERRRPEQRDVSGGEGVVQTDKQRDVSGGGRGWSKPTSRATSGSEHNRMETEGRQTPGCCSVLAATLDLPCVFVNINLTLSLAEKWKKTSCHPDFNFIYALTPTDRFLDLASLAPFVFMPSALLLVATR